MGDGLKRAIKAARATQKPTRSELVGALLNARSMLESCGLEDPDDPFQAVWDKHLGEIDAVINRERN